MNNRLLITLTTLLYVACGTQQKTAQHGQAEKHRLLLLPIEESAPTAQIDYKSSDSDPITLNVKLARNKVDYYVPLALNDINTEGKIKNLPESAIAWKTMKFSNRYKVGKDKFRPQYHFAPLYGWMNDPNGMVYKDGEYHLFYQYNPYGATWGNMHWGHAVTRNLVDWEHLPVAITPDKNGAAYSGSSVVDHDNVAGFGADAIVSFYTSKSNREAQSIAYSTDNGRTFTKYEHNPILCSDERDFRDPKVIYHAGSKQYIMALAVGQNIEFYSSKNLKDWQFESKFGETYGVHGTGYAVWECPDLIELNIEGSNEKRWVLLVNINGHGPASGGSATQYFIGNFDGHRFTCEDDEKQVKWQDYGKDHYAAVTWSNSPDNRTLAIAWMNNWQYANQVPTTWFRSSNTIVRSLSLFSHKGDLYLASKPVEEHKQRRVKAKKISRTSQITFTLKRGKSQNATFSLANSLGESVDFNVDFNSNSVVVDRTKSGDTSFSNAFAIAAKAPIMGEGYHFDIFIDTASVECFINDGKTVLTNTVFPTEPYNNLHFDEECEVEDFTIYRY